MAVRDLRERHEVERAAERVWLHGATDATSAIRLRLAAVANELRQAALTADGSSENLLALANKFEEHARAGDNR